MPARAAAARSSPARAGSRTSTAQSVPPESGKGHQGRLGRAAGAEQGDTAGAGQASGRSRPRPGPPAGRSTSVLSARQPPPASGRRVLAAPTARGVVRTVLRQFQSRPLQRHRARESGPVDAVGQHAGQVVDAALDGLVAASPARGRRRQPGAAPATASALPGGRERRLAERSQPQPQLLARHAATAVSKSAGLVGEEPEIPGLVAVDVVEPVPAAGCTAACRADSPGFAIGVGGRPWWV